MNRFEKYVMTLGVGAVFGFVGGYAFGVWQGGLCGSPDVACTRIKDETEYCTVYLKNNNRVTMQREVGDPNSGFRRTIDLIDEQIDELNKEKNSRIHSDKI